MLVVNSYRCIWTIELLIAFVQVVIWKEFHYVMQSHGNINRIIKFRALTIMISGASHDVSSHVQTRMAKEHVLKKKKKITAVRRGHPEANDRPTMWAQYVIIFTVE